ncbi:shikimate kinase [Candidatus Atelocyanobacterium thalassae]|uniref:Shikimate kinase n=1 Tax=cyanobacterium endosymbiont of Braarudosphaera bigelowii TaxID=1285375 RepID=A0ABM7U410_9CHRO|nr:shikimate kinase [Candidatus Atelocyanobacterium thalassa]BDA39346.1 shikimate kinase [cyanobacterium endosymbiont of Braarudosphaera bigelowii]
MANELLQGINIFLVGMMGSGKTTIGKKLAQHLKYRFFDTDILVEQVKRQTISNIFLEEGEEAFRILESKVLSELASCTKSVVATGGGIILEQKNWSYLHHGLIIWLDVPIPLLTKRLNNGISRPLLKQKHLSTELETLFKQRQTLYAQGDLRVTISENDSSDDTVNKILKLIPTIIKTSSPDISN